MLQKLNEGIKGWVATVIVVAISVSFVIFGISYYLNSRSGSSAVVAKVGSAVITNKELQTALRREQYAREKTHGALSKSDLKFLKQMVLNSLIQETLTQQALDQLGIKVSQRATEQAIQSLPAFQQNGRYSPEILQQRLSNAGITLKQLMAQISSQLVTKQLQMGVSLAAFTSPKAIKSIYNWTDQTRRFRYVVVSPALFASNSNVTAAELNAYYQANQRAYTLPDRVMISYLDLNPKEIAKGIAITPTQVKQYYESNKNQFRAAAVYRYADVVVLKPGPKHSAVQQQEKAADINAALKSGKQLKAIAKQFGGSVQSATADQLNPSVLGLLETLQPGQVLSDQKVEAGTLWLQLISVKAGAVKPFASVQSQIKAMLISQKVKEKMAPMTEKLSDVTYTDSSSLKSAAKALGLPIKQSGWVSKAGTESGLFTNKKLINAAFSDEVQGQGNNSMPITLADGSVVVLRVKTFKKAEVRPLAEVKAQVMQHVKATAAQLKAAVFAGSLQQALEQKKPVLAMMAAHHLHWKQVASATRKDKAVNSALLKAVFSFAKVPAVGTVADKGATTVVQLQTITLPKKQLTDQQKDSFSQSVRSFYSQMDMAAVVTSVEKTIKVKRYPKRME